MQKKVFVNRTLNFKKIQYVGFDMDHTLVRYNTHNFEAHAHSVMKKKLISKGYPNAINSFKYETDRTIRGLVIDRRMGNLLKLNRYSGIRMSVHGSKPIDFATQKKLYKSIYIDLGDSNYSPIDTSFSISFALLFSQLVDLKDSEPQLNLPTYEAISRDLELCLDEAHRDGSLKDEVKQNLDKYIIKDPAVVKGLERLKTHGKKLFLLTNSHYDYTKALLDYAINPFVKKNKSWLDIFDYVITGGQKPRFFWDKLPVYKINPELGTMIPSERKDMPPGVYHGGCASIFTDSLGVVGEDILYIGDHIYGDILRLKKDCNWRTALIFEELDVEVEGLKKAKPIDEKINALMEKKEPFEDQLLEMFTESKESGREVDDALVDKLQNTINKIDQEISELIKKRQQLFNSNWGEILRIGNEESSFAYQMERFACIYMSKLSDFFEISPRSYLRGPRRLMPHELEL